MTNTEKTRMTFTLTDEVTGAKLDGDVSITPGAIGLRFDGYGDKASEPGHGEPIYLELYDGKLMLRVWSDINSEDATHTIDMSGAREDEAEPE